MSARGASREVPGRLNAAAQRDFVGRAVIRIIPETRQVEKARAYAKRLARNVAGPVFVSDTQGTILQADDGASALLGFRTGGLVEQCRPHLASLEEARVLLAALREVVQRGVTRNVRLNPRRASGEVIPTSLKASPLRDRNGRVIGAIGVLCQSRGYVHTLQDAHKNNLRAQAGRETTADLVGAVGGTAAEVHRSGQQLREKEEQFIGELATLGEHTAGVAHELSNPLNNICLFVGNAIERIQPADSRPLVSQSELRQAVGEMRQALQQVHKAADIISNLRMFARAAAVRREPLDLQDVIEQAVTLVRGEHRMRGVEVIVGPGLAGAVVLGNRIQLEQVFVNLLTNACDALADSPRKVVRMSGSAGPAAVEVAFADTGAGIAPGLERRIFEPFFTTKDFGNGMGLGLSISYGIIREHGGTISVVSPPGEGATFLVRLPLAPR